MKRILYPFLLLAVLAACAPATGPTTTETPEQVAIAEPPQLTDGTWRLLSLQEAGGAQLDLQEQVYSLTFAPDGNVGAQLDCNTGGGSYELDGNGISFGPVVSTLMFCSEDSLASNFGVALTRVESYAISGDELILSAEDGTSLRFALQPEQG